MSDLNPPLENNFPNSSKIVPWYNTLADQVKANEVDRACGTHGTGEKSVQGFGGKARRKKTT
jgi:hypothetical protein